MCAEHTLALPTSGKQHPSPTRTPASLNSNERCCYISVGQKLGYNNNKILFISIVQILRSKRSDFLVLTTSKPWDREYQPQKQGKSTYIKVEVSCMSRQILRRRRHGRTVTAALDFVYV